MELTELYLREAQIWQQLGQWARVQKVLEQPAVRDSERVLCRVYAALLQHHLDLARGKPTGDTLARALTLLPEGERPDLRLPLLIEQAQTLPAADALRQLERVIEQAAKLQHRGTVLAAHVRAAAAAVTVDGVVAVKHAEEALRMFASVRTTALQPAELWLQCARAFTASGNADRAVALLSEGRDWIARTVRDHVPDPFRHSFLNRNHVVRDLLELASRVCAE